MKKFVLVFLLWASVAHADPVTTGTWAIPTAVPNEGSPFYNGLSWDCEQCGLAWTMKNVEYLHQAGNPFLAASFTWLGPLALTDLGGTSDYYQNGQSFMHDEGTGEFRLDNGHGWTSTSTNGGAILLRFVAPSWTQYWIWFEDLPPWRQDRDYQDRGFSWTVSTLTLPPPTPGDPAPVPEPMTMFLVGSGLLGLARLRRKS